MSPAVLRTSKVSSLLAATRTLSNGLMILAWHPCPYQLGAEDNPQLIMMLRDLGTNLLPSVNSWRTLDFRRIDRALDRFAAD